MICRLNGVCNEKCDKQCALVVGDNLVRFLREIDTIESRIGEFAGDPEQPVKFITSGLQIDDTSNPTHILTDISVSIDVSKKFTTSFGKTAMSILNDYIKLTQIPDGAELREKLRKLEVNKLLIMPIKPKMNCEVLLEDDKEKAKPSFKSTCVDVVKWLNSPKTNMMECTMLTEVIDGTLNKRGKASITDYGDKFRLTDAERSINNTDVDRATVRMSRFSYVKPIVVVDKKGNGIAIDNTYMYLIDGESAKIIAYWDKQGLVGEDLYNEVTKTPVFKKVKKSINYISQHRRYIAPYGLAECNKIEI